MVYGTPIATTTTYHDLTLCLRCSAYAYTHYNKEVHGDFFFWLRDLSIGEADTAGFVRNMAHTPVRDCLSTDPTATLSFLMEGQDQEELNEAHCDKCLIPLVTLCQDYP